MKKLTRNQWVAVSVSLVVVVIFFATGSSLISFFSSASETGLTANALDSTLDTKDTKNMDDTTPTNALDSSVSGLEIQDITVGTGAEATQGKIISVNYSGAFTDGKIFDSSYTRGVPFEFTLGAGQVIAGWDKGFAGMKVGGKRRLVIPPAFGYGTAGVPGAIPPNSTLVFEVELLGVR